MEELVLGIASFSHAQLKVSRILRVSRRRVPAPGRGFIVRRLRHLVGTTLLPSGTRAQTDKTLAPPPVYSWVSRPMKSIGTYVYSLPSLLQYIRVAESW